MRWGVLGSGCLRMISCNAVRSRDTRIWLHDETLARNVRWTEGHSIGKKQAMFKRSWAIGAIAVLLLSRTAAAQSPGAPFPGTVEIGGFGQWTWFDGNAGRENAVPKDGLGYGGRIGVFFSERLQLEGDGYYSPQGRDPSEAFCCIGAQPTDVDASAFALRLNYNLPLLQRMNRQTQFILGVGAVRTNYKFSGGSEPESDNSSYGASGLAGLRIGVANRVAVRLDGVVDHMPGHEPSANTNVHARAGVSLLLGGASSIPMAAALPSPPPPSPSPPPPPPPPPADRQIQVCVVQNGQLQTVSASFRPTTSDTVIGGRAFAQAHPTTTPNYAGGAAWFIQQDTMVFNERTWVKFGVIRVVQPPQVQRVGENMGTPVFAEAGRQAPYEVIYVPVRPGCEFQPYQARAAIRARG